MIVIKAIEKLYEDIDENGQPVTRTCFVPETAIPDTALRVECDGVNYTVFEQGD